MDLLPDLVARVPGLPGGSGVFHPGFYGCRSKFAFGERYPVWHLPLRRSLPDDPVLGGIEDEWSAGKGLKSSFVSIPLAVERRNLVVLNWEKSRTAHP